MKFACVFPGQGSQSIGMLNELSMAFPVVRETFAEASDTLGIDCWSMVSEGPEESLNRTENTQPILLAASISVWRIWNHSHGSQPQLLAGHSFGEYSALVCAGALEFPTAVSLARERGRLMTEAVAEGDGAMAAILGLGDDEAIEVCARAADGEIVSAVNFNAPRQVVIAGHTAAVERAIKLAREAGAKRAVRLAVSVPAHCSLMKAAADKLAQHLVEAQIKTPEIPVLHNVDVVSHTQSADIVNALVCQLYSPVRWSETIRKMSAQGAKVILEIGPGKVLTGLNKRIDRSLAAVCVQDPASLEKAVDICEEAR